MKHIILIFAALVSSVAFADFEQVLPIVRGGTSKTTAQSAIDTLAGSVTNNQVLLGNGTHIVLGALTGAYLPNPSSSTLGGIESIASQSHKWINTISTSGVPSLTQPDFSDLTGTATIAQSTIATQAISASNIDWSTGSVFTKTLSANTTLTFSNQTSGQTIVVRLTNTASNYTVTWPGTIKWPGQSAPTETIGAFSDVITCVYDGTTTYCNSVQNF